MFLRFERVVENGDGQFDVEEWLSENVGSQISMEHDVSGSSTKKFKELFMEYTSLTAPNGRPTYAVDTMARIQGDGYYVIVAFEYEGFEIRHEDWLVNIYDPASAVHFKLMTC